MPRLRRLPPARFSAGRSAAKDRFPRHCIGPVLRSAELWRDALDGDRSDVIPEGTRAGYAKLYSHLAENGFHCAKAVLADLGYSPTAHPELFDATSAFMGGTLFMGRTCGAFIAGVMAIGLEAGEIEDSRLRVIRLLAIMTVGGDAFDDRLNKFNPSMNRGYRLVEVVRERVRQHPVPARSPDATSLTPKGVAQLRRGD